MDGPDDEKGKVYIRTKFGEVAAGDWFPNLSEADMIEDEEWRKKAGVEGGPFCYTDAERLMPF